MAWLDAITMGEVKKQKLPKGLLEAKVAEEEVKIELPPVESPAEEVPPPPVEENKPEHEEL